MSCEVQVGQVYRDNAWGEKTPRVLRVLSVGLTHARMQELNSKGTSNFAYRPTKVRLDRFFDGSKPRKTGFSLTSLVRI